MIVAAATIFVVLLQSSIQTTTAFSLLSTTTTSRTNTRTTISSSSNNNEGYFIAPTSDIQSIDVSDLGLTLDDFDVTFPKSSDGGIQITTSGYESTSMIPSVDDNGVSWEEDSNIVGVKLSIPGLRGQPIAAMDVQITSNTCTVTVFGYAVWSCLLKGECLPESSSFQIEDGKDMLPLITVSVEKKNNEIRWDGFILSIGEDSIL
ncbi:hypothetical protein FRACYDRAFT_187093 [Fragilariopsis cylindrus CCMP1102]|uniref:Uncharacterized protein n=1 Tax=Fragilariopsis cylindrus CCMP1102 TaxID=635003 RepID=A0A1E7FCM9_9STRA|nr:hypothetical protein FRACYDRAFT_187093 [Fragilariopsis cylindrus CCMP1102]|eukprot:OEU15942.1 hypothetical protein FRACYDRAFT_187093 [Fragilariopsis cylindrus CCMP1102]